MFRVIIMSVLCLVLTASGCASSDPVSTPTLDLPDDIGAAGLETAPASVDNAIPRGQAIEIADSEYGERYGGARTTAYLVELTIPDSAAGDYLIHDRPVWLIRYSGLAIPVNGPVSPDSASDEATSVGHAYVVLDARSGVWLLTKETA